MGKVHCACGTFFGLLFLGAAAGATYLFLAAPDAVNCGEGWAVSIFALLFGAISFGLFKDFEPGDKLPSGDAEDSIDGKKVCQWCCTRRERSLSHSPLLGGEESQTLLDVSEDMLSGQQIYNQVVDGDKTMSEVYNDPNMRGQVLAHML